MLEAELRHHEDQIYAMQSRLVETESNLRTAQREADLLRTQLAQRDQPPLLPEQTHALAQIAALRVHPLFTGGIDQDGQPGDEAVNVLLAPQDDDGANVKVAGDVELELLDLSQPEGRRRVGYWNFDAPKTRDHWHSGLAEGFQFRLPWQRTPQSGELVLRAKLVTPDGREFLTSKEVRVEMAQQMEGSGSGAKDEMETASGTAPPLPLTPTDPQDIRHELTTDFQPPAPEPLLPEKTASAGGSLPPISAPVFRPVSKPTMLETKNPFASSSDESEASPHKAGRASVQLPVSSDTESGAEWRSTSGSRGTLNQK